MLQAGRCARLVRQTMSALDEAEYVFAPEESPPVPGAPFLPSHVAWRRLAYFAVALVIALVAMLGNALVSVNLVPLAGASGDDIALISFLPALFLSMGACGNLLLIKGRQQFGIPLIMNWLLLADALAALLQIVFPGFATAASVSATSGLAAAGLTTLGIYYLMQVLPAKARPAALVIGLGFVQLAIPLARLFPVEWLAQDHWRNLCLVEFALPLAALAAITIFPLPPTQISPAFEPLDAATIALAAPGIVLVCATLIEGRILWWTDTPWIGWALAAAALLLLGAFLIESRRQRPMLRLEWLSTGDILRLAAVAFLMRVALAEQTFGSVGLLSAGGLNNDQLRLLFSFVALAMAAGAVVAVVTMGVETLRYQVMAAAAAIALGAWLDSQSNDLTRPEQLYLSQALIGFGTTLFVGPALAYGMMRMKERGADHFISIVVMYSATQYIGALAGASLLGSLQTISMRAHLDALSENLVGADPQVAARLQGGAYALSSQIIDPAQRGAQGAGLLAKAMGREAAVLSFNDVFQFVAMLASVVALYMLVRIVLSQLRGPMRAGAQT